MVSIEKQLITAQNELLEYKKNELKNTVKCDELAERADFYENLHNNEQRKLYETEEKCKTLEEANQNYEEKCKILEDDNIRYKEENEYFKIQFGELREKNIENISTKRLWSIIWKRVKYKVIGR